MAKDNEGQMKMADPSPKPATKSAFSLIDPRDHFIGIALGKLLDQAIEKGDIGKYDMTAAHAVRYGDAVMRAKGQESKPLTSGQGKIVPQLPLPPLSQGQITDNDGNVVGRETPKTIAEQLTGPAELLAEVT